MTYCFNPSLYRGQVLAFPTELIEAHIRLCSSFSLKCLLLLWSDPLRYPDAAAIAERLGQSLSEVADALAYWEDSGVLLRQEDVASPPSQIVPTPAVSAPSAPVPTPTAASVPPTAAVPSTRPRLTREEAVELVDQDELLRSLQQELQGSFGKLFTSTDFDILVALYSYYGLSPHFILTVVQYCLNHGKRSMAYVEKTAAAWMEQGVTDQTVDVHVERLGQRSTIEAQLRRALGITDRNFIPKEREQIALWNEQYGFSVEIITYAYELTVERTGKRSFPYMGKILDTWHQKKLHTLEEIQSEARSLGNAPSRTPAVPGSPPPMSEMDRKIIEQFMKG